MTLPLAETMFVRRLGTSAAGTVPGETTGCEDVAVVNSILVLNAFGLLVAYWRLGSRPKPIPAVPVSVYCGLLRLSAWHLKQISYSFTLRGRKVLALDCPRTPNKGGVSFGACGL